MVREHYRGRLVVNSRKYNQPTETGFPCQRIIATKLMAKESKHCGFSYRLCPAVRLNLQ
jgi:hypothetical protein